MKIESLIENLRKADGGKVLITPKATVGPDDLGKWEKEHCSLPQDYKLFLSEIGECKIRTFTDDPSNYAVKLLRLSEVKQYSDIYDLDDVTIPERWFAAGDLLDGNYLIVDLASIKDDSVDLIDGYMEDIGFDLEIVAKSFTEFLAKILDDTRISSGGGGGMGFWSKTKPAYGNYTFDD